MYLVFTRMPGQSYRRRLRSLLLHLYYAFRISRVYVLRISARWLTPWCVDSENCEQSWMTVLLSPGFNQTHLGWNMQKAKWTDIYDRNAFKHEGGKSLSVTWSKPFIIQPKIIIINFFLLSRKRRTPFLHKTPKIGRFTWQWHPVQRGEGSTKQKQIKQEVSTLCTRPKRGGGGGERERERGEPS